MHFEFKKVAWKIVIAFTVNGILLGLFLICKISPHTAASSPSLRLRLISVILRHRSPKAMNVSDRSTETNNPTVQTITGITETKNAENIALKAMWDFTPANRQNLSVLPKSSAKYKYELERIEQGVRTVDDINQAKTGLPEGILPTGHQTGTSFQEHGNVQVRNKLLKRRGGSEKRNPLFKRCWHISLRRTPLTATGEVSTASKWKMLRLSLRLLYWLFSHGGNFQSATYGDNIRRGCDFF